MVPRNSDLIPGAPWWTNAVIKFGSFGILAFLLWQNNEGQRETAKVLVASNVKTADTLPGIAAEIRDDNRKTAEFMRTYTAAAQMAREKTETRLANIEKEIVLQKELIRALTDAINRLVSGLEAAGKNALPSTPKSGGG